MTRLWHSQALMASVKHSDLALLGEVLRAALDAEPEQRNGPQRGGGVHATGHA